MCDYCSQIQQLIKDRKINLKLVQQLIDENKIELYAGNCYPNEIEKYLDEGRHYTINTYYRCKKCKKYFYIGFCLYGRPIIKETSLEDAKCGALRFEWGYKGIYFLGKNKKLMIK